MNKVSYIHWFNDIGIDDVPLVGGKNASLGEMYQNLTAEGVRIWAPGVRLVVASKI